MEFNVADPGLGALWSTGCRPRARLDSLYSVSTWHR